MRSPRSSTGRLPRIHGKPPRGTSRYLVLAAGEDDLSCVDLSTGALVRLRHRQAALRASSAATAGGSTDRLSGLGGEHAGSPLDSPGSDGYGDEVGGLHEDPGSHLVRPVEPLCVVEARLCDDPEQDDLAQPEAFSIDAPPRTVGRMGRRRTRQILHRVAAPRTSHLLGFPGVSAPYWEFRGMHPSVAVVSPPLGPMLFRRPGDGAVWARFGWPRSDNWLPVEDQRAIAVFSGPRTRMSAKELSEALGFRPHYLVITLSSPRDGYCYKTLAAILGRP